MQASQKKTRAATNAKKKKKTQKNKPKQIPQKLQDEFTLQTVLASSPPAFAVLQKDFGHK